MIRFARYCQVAVFYSVWMFLETGAGGQDLPRPIPVATGARAMVATVHPLATEAGVKTLDGGGNAVDAAIAAALTLGVVDGFNSGIGGGCFILIRSSDGTFVAIDGRETAPAAAFRDMYLREGKPDTNLSQHGPLAVGVPGALAAYAQAVETKGRTRLAELLLAAAAIAEQGFEITPTYASALRGERRELARWEGSRHVFFRDEGTLKSAGELLVQTDLANTYRNIAEHGCDWFYRGPFADAIADWMAAHGGLITREDFANYQTVLREPLVTTYRTYTIIGFPPPSSGGVHVAQILNILENFDLPKVQEASSADAMHVICESMKLAFADRAHWLGDPAFANVPRGLVDKSYGRALAGRIRLDLVTDVGQHGDPTDFDPRWFDKHTTHIAAADEEGNWVAITTTVNTTFGSKVIVPGTGVILNNQMDDFSIAPGVPNAFGLIGNDANAVAPGKRPLSSMSPTIVLHDGEPVMTIGAAGGPRIITQVLLGMVRYLDFGMPIEDAVAQPRFHQQWAPPQLYVERGLEPELARAMETRGHCLAWTSEGGITQAIVRRDGMFFGVSDPRTSGSASAR